MSDKWCPENDGAYRAELAYIEKHASASRDAAEITRLRADLAAAQEREQRMREALEHYAEPCDAPSDGPCPYDGNMCCKVARAALGESQ